MAAFAILVSAILVGLSEAHFKCHRNVTQFNNTHELLDLKPLLSLESVCLDFCKQANCSTPIPGGLLGGGATGDLLGSVANSVGGLLSSGPAQCLLDPNGDGSNPNKVTNYQACAFPCILNLNLLNVCDVQAIVTSLVSVCPNADLRGLCVSACLCCGNETIDVCVNLCLGSRGIHLNISPLRILGLGDDKSKSNSKEDGFKLPGLPVFPGKPPVIGSHSDEDDDATATPPCDDETTQPPPPPVTTPC